MKIYLDHNVLDALSKGHFKLNPPEGTVWIYSNETLNEIKRSGDRRFLDVLRTLKAKKIELVLDGAFRLTGDAYIHEFRDPHDFYQEWLDATSQCPIDEEANLQLLSRLAGGDNHSEILQYPSRIREQIHDLLGPHDLLTGEIEGQVESVISDINDIVHGPMQEIKDLEHSRYQIGTGRGRAGNTRLDNNPIESLWLLIKDQAGGMSLEQYFRLNPEDKQGYETWPLYLGVVGCHTVLNFLGFQSDKGLNNIEKLPGILSDANHTAMGIYCDAILSKDKKFCAKARAIYTYLGLPTKVLEISNISV